MLECPFCRQQAMIIVQDEPMGTMFVCTNCENLKEDRYF